MNGDNGRISTEAWGKGLVEDRKFLEKALRQVYFIFARQGLDFKKDFSIEREPELYAYMNGE